MVQGFHVSGPHSWSMASESDLTRHACIHDDSHTEELETRGRLVHHRSPGVAAVMEDGDIAEAVQRALQTREARVNGLSAVASVILVLTGLAFAMPAIQAGLTVQALGPAILLAVMALLVNDLILWGPRGRSRVGAACAAAAPILIAYGLTTLVLAQRAGLGQSVSVMMLQVAWLPAVLGCLYAGGRVLRGSDDAVRYRGMAQLFGIGVGGAVVLSSPASPALLLGPGALLAPAGHSILIGGPDRALVRRFRSELDTAEGKVLVLRADGVVVDQASSLVKEAKQVGHRDPRDGLRLIAQAMDDVERIVALADDLGAIREESVRAVEVAAGIAPIAKRPQRCMTMGDREAELGSLREAEMLFREAKRRSVDIEKHWQVAEDSIAEAKSAISAVGGIDRERLDSMLQAAEEALSREEPADAWAIAMTIPAHVENLGEAIEGAVEAVEEATAALERAEGLDRSEWVDRLAQARVAMEAGDASMARGLADSIQREIVNVGEAKQSVQRALRQKRKMTERWSGRSDSQAWDARLAEAKQAADGERWIEAQGVLEEIATDLDAAGSAVAEARELLDFLHGEWRTLRPRLESAGVKAANEDRRTCESAVAEATAAVERGDIDVALLKLGEADAAMERLRRLA